MLNDESRTVKWYLDRDFVKPEGLIGVHPNDNTATVWLKVEDLLSVIGEHGNAVEIVDLAEPSEADRQHLCNNPCNPVNA